MSFYVILVLQVCILQNRNRGACIFLYHALFFNPFPLLKYFIVLFELLYNLLKSHKLYKEYFIKTIYNAEFFIIIWRQIFLYLYFKARQFLDVNCEIPFRKIVLTCHRVGVKISASLHAGQHLSSRSVALIPKW
jgi:hypothetical protein